MRRPRARAMNEWLACVRLSTRERGGAVNGAAGCAGGIARTHAHSSVNVRWWSRVLRLVRLAEDVRHCLVLWLTLLQRLGCISPSLASVVGSWEMRIGPGGLGQRACLSVSITYVNAHVGGQGGYLEWALEKSKRGLWEKEMASVAVEDTHPNAVSTLR